MERLHQGERWVWAAITAVLFFSLLRAEDRSRLQRQEAVRTTEALRRELQSAQSGLTAPPSRRAPLALQVGALDWTPEQGDRLRPRLADDLRNHGELIPYQGEEGLSSEFLGAEEVRVIGPTWAVASFEDGHAGGKALLRYQEGPNGAITWQFLDGYLESPRRARDSGLQPLCGRCFTP